MFRQIPVRREVFGGGENLLVCGDVMELPEEIRALAGRVQCVYVDPPFMTGERFTRSRPFGTRGWKTGSPAPKYPAFEDRYEDEAAYLELLNRLVSGAWELLGKTGVFYLHLDWRMAARARLACDRIFGKEGFLNEIIWAYESGGRSKRYFPRKHDGILLYAKSGKYKFDLTRVPLPRVQERKNHMARGVDEQGRPYSKIVSGGKEYRYYDDDPVYPGDVWTDISHLQQRDPERTGYATQKPVRLLERLLLPVTNEGDWVVDLCCGSGTTLEAAQRLGCRFAGLDRNPEAVAVTLSRLKAENLTVICDTSLDQAALRIREDPTEGSFSLEGLEAEHPSFPENAAAADVIEAWETGTLEEGVFRAERRFCRSFRYPELTTTLRTDPRAIDAVMVTDAAGRRRAYGRKGS